MYPRTPVKATIPSDTQNPGNGLSRRRLCAGPPARAAHREESEPGREAGGGWMSRRASPPLATMEPPETAQCRWPQRFAAARALSSHIYSARGLDDDRYLVERFQSMADGEILPRARQRGLEEGPGQGFPRGRLPEHRPADEARARRDHHLHGRSTAPTSACNIGGDRAVGLFVNAKYR